MQMYPRKNADIIYIRRICHSVPTQKPRLPWVPKGMSHLSTPMPINNNNNGYVRNMSFTDQDNPSNFFKNLSDYCHLHTKKMNYLSLVILSTVFLMNSSCCRHVRLVCCHGTKSQVITTILMFLIGPSGHSHHLGASNVPLVYIYF
jgi:hypothetical protein